MGLGKTVQCISFIAALLGKTGTAADMHEPQLAPLAAIEPPESGCAGAGRQAAPGGRLRVAPAVAGLG